MKSFLPRLALVLAAVCLAPAVARPAETNATVDFRELYELLRTNLAGADEALLNRAAANGLLNQLKSRVTLLTGPAPASDSDGPALAGASVFDRAYAYLRVSRITPGLDKMLADAYGDLAASNRLRGVVLDLRYADGQDYAAAVSVADRFFASEKPLLDWGQGERSSIAKSDAIPGPVAVLINQETFGAAEALAAVLRRHDLALLIGGPSSGTASISKDFSLKSGARVRVAVAPVKVAKGEALSPAGLKPDIRVEVLPENEHAWFKDAYLLLARSSAITGGQPALVRDSGGSSTNRPARRRMNEADLERMLREGQTPDADTTNVAPREAEPAQPILRDPALVRALDLLKALAVVQKYRPN